MTPVHYSVIATICLLQLFASVFRFEQQPVLSDYPMYSSTYPSTAVFDETATIQSPHRVYARTVDGEGDVTAALQRADLHGPLRDLLLELRRGVPFTPDAQERLGWIASTFRERSGQPLGVVTLLRDELAFDWTNGNLYTMETAMALLEVDTETLSVVTVSRQPD